MIRNQAEKPVYLRIDDDLVEIRGADYLWGKDTQATSDIICQELGSSGLSRPSVLAIGPAGENLVRFACPINDYHHCAARSGAGAVMGAKKLKAIAIRGTGSVKTARPEEFQEAVRLSRERLMAAVSAINVSDAAADIRAANLERGCLPGKNFQTGVVSQWLETRGIEVARKYITKKEGTCYSCPVSCFKLAEVKEGRYAGVKANRGDHPGVVLDWGAKCAIDNLPAIWKCKELCQHFGLDYASAAGCIAFAMELYQRGIITTTDTEGLELNWGNEDATIQMLQKIAYREGFGDVLAEGSVRAAQTIGKGAEQYAMVIKDMEMMMQDPRADRKGWCIGTLTNPRGGDNIKNTHCLAEKYHHNWWVDKFDMFDDVKEKIYSMPPQEVSYTWEGKPLMCKWFEDLYSVANALGLCLFPSGFALAWGPTHFSKLFSTCTGWDITPKDIMKFGEKIFTLLKAYTVRQGLTRKDDTWPDRFFNDSLPEGPARGAILSRETIE